MNTSAYVHGYARTEGVRLRDQASTLAELIHGDTRFPPGSRVLEAGCGVGAQTLIMAAQNPGVRFVSVDLSPASVAQARAAAAAAGLRNVEFQPADIFHLPFAPHSFDHVVLCFVLEHLPEPVVALNLLRGMVKPGGTLVAIEGDHGSTSFHPDSVLARRAVACQVELQRRAGGNALIGRELFPLLTRAGFQEVAVSPRLVYVDGSRPALVDGFIRKTFTAMIAGVPEAALAAGLMPAAEFDQGVRDLYRTAEPDGVFCYTFFKAVGRVKAEIGKAES